jgi:hypothetical protein
MSDLEIIEHLIAAKAVSRRRELEHWQVTWEDVAAMDEFLEKITKDDIPKLFPNQIDHFMGKWEYEADPWGFYRSLDYGNRQRLVALHAGNSERILIAEDFMYGLSSWFCVAILSEIWSNTTDVEAAYAACKIRGNQWALWRFYHGLAEQKKRDLIMWYNNLMMNR